jgi:hypothetical protein
VRISGARVKLLLKNQTTTMTVKPIQIDKLKAFIFAVSNIEGWVIDGITS